MAILEETAASGEMAREISAGRLWRPRRVLITPEAYGLERGRRMLERVAATGAEVVRLGSNRLTRFNGETAGQSYALAKTTLAIVVSPPGQRKLQPIPPSADWQFHLAQGCPAHCQYCYLAGSLSGPPVTRAYANLEEILEGLRPYAGVGQVTSRSSTRAGEGTTFEASCYTDPLGIEHLTGSLGEAVRFFGEWDAPVQLRFTTKFDGVGELAGLEHRGRTRVRFSVNAASVSRDFEGGTASVGQRLIALHRMALGGYPVGLTIAPIMPVEGWREEYTALLGAVAEVLLGISGVDLTVELITHRFTPGSKEVLLGWYPKTTLDLREEARSEKRTKFGGSSMCIRRTRWGRCGASSRGASGSCCQGRGCFTGPSTEQIADGLGRLQQQDKRRFPAVMTAKKQGPLCETKADSLLE